MSLDQASDDDEIVDNVINKITSFSTSNIRQSNRYANDYSMKDFEFTGENIFKKGKDAFDGTFSKDSTIDHNTNDFPVKEVNLPLQITKSGNENKSANIAVKKKAISKSIGGKEIEIAV